MSDHRVIFLLAIGFAVLMGVIADSADSGNGQNNTDDELEPTRLTAIERTLKKIAGIVSPDESSENRNRLGKLVGSLIPKTVKNATGKSFGHILNKFEKNFHAIFPGTLWCGSGNIAGSIEDTGYFSETDDCCRTHDECPSNMEAGETKGRLLNNGIFTRSDCSCDDEFYKCLKTVNSVVSNNIGRTFFNILKPQCFAIDHPIESCIKYEWKLIGGKTCVEYRVDDTAPKRLVWFDHPGY